MHRQSPTRIPDDVSVCVAEQRPDLPRDLAPDDFVSGQPAHRLQAVADFVRILGPQQPCDVGLFGALGVELWRTKAVGLGLEVG